MGRSGRGSRKIGGDTAMQKSPTRRSVTAGLALGALAAPGLRIAPARAQAKSVKMAMIAPLSGPWARQGQLLREGAGLDKVGLKPVVDQIFTPPLSDATPLVDKVRSAKPDFLLLLTSAMPDCKLVLEKLEEFKLAKGKIPLVGNGAPFGSPELLKTIGPELLEGLLFSVANWPLKGQEEFIERFKKRTSEPFLTQDGLCGYGHTWILKEALERAGTADKLKVAEAIRTMNLTTGPAALSFPGPIKFDDKGRRQEVPMIFAQWQKGVPVTVYPEDRAVAKPFWPSV